MFDLHVSLMLTALLMLGWLIAFAPAVVTGADAPNTPPPKERKPWQDLLMFKGGGGKAPSPDPNIGLAALREAELGEEWLSFAREQFDVSNERQAELDELTKRIGEQQVEMADRQLEWSQQDRERYQDQFQPLEDDFLDKAKTWDSDERQAQRASEARADVLQSAASERAAGQRQMASMGVNPASGRFQGMDRASELQTGLSAAGAQNRARNQVRQEALALQGDAINIGRGLPAQSAQAAAMGLGAGNSALAGAQGAHGAFMGNSQIMGQGYQGAMAGQSGMANILNQQYQNQLQAWSANRQAASQGIGGFFGAVGSGIGTYAALSSSEDKKTNKQPVKGALAALRGLPVEAWEYTEDAQRQPVPADVIPPDAAPHVGTYAEDFQEQTGLGDGSTIPIQDAIGVTMAAVKELDEKVDNIASRKKRARA